MVSEWQVEGKKQTSKWVSDVVEGKANQPSKVEWDD